MSFLLQKIFETIKEHYWDAMIYFESNEITFFCYGKEYIVTLREKNENNY